MLSALAATGNGAHLPYRASTSLFERVFHYDTFDDLEALLTKTLTSGFYDVIVHLAAVSDFVVANVAESGKLPSGAETTLQLVPTKKLLKFIREKMPSSTIVGFKLTSSASAPESLSAVRKVFENGADYVVHNDQTTITDDGHVFSLYNNDEMLGFCSRKEELSELIVNGVLKKDTSPSPSNPEVTNDLMS